MRVTKRLRTLEVAMTPGPFGVDPDLREGGVDQLVELKSGKQLTIAFGTSNGNTQDLYGLAVARNMLPKLLDLAEASHDVMELVAGAVKCGCVKGVRCEVCAFVRAVVALREMK